MPSSHPNTPWPKGECWTVPMCEGCTWPEVGPSEKRCPDLLLTQPSNEESEGQHG